MAIIQRGKSVKVGDTVGFKSDIEQYGIIIAIKGDILVLKPHGEYFHGDYLRDEETTVEKASDCWQDDE